MLMNVLESALSLLPSVTWEFRRYTGSTVDEKGVSIPQFGEWTVCRGFAAPVQSSKYQSMGLDFAKNYYNFWGSVELHGQDVQKVPDQVRLFGRIYIVQDDTDWFLYNGWHTVTAYEDKRMRPEAEAVAGTPQIDESKVIHPPKEGQTEPSKTADWS